MPKQSFALEPGGPKRVEIEWRGIWKELKVRFDDTLLGEIPDGKALREGRTFAIDGGKHTLRLQLVQTFLSAELHVIFDGRPLPGTSSDPEVQLKLTATLIYFIGGLTILAGLAAWLFHVELLVALGIGPEVAIAGVVFVLLGLLVRYKRSKVALAVAIVLLALDVFLTIADTVEVGSRPPVGMLVFRMLMIVWLFRGFAAINALKNVPLPAPKPLSTGVEGPRREGEDPFDPPRK